MCCPTCMEPTEAEALPKNYALLDLKVKLSSSEFLNRDISDIVDTAGGSCPVCLDPYTHKTPMVLECGHTLCSKCVLTIAMQVLRPTLIPVQALHLHLPHHGCDGRCCRPTSVGPEVSTVLGKCLQHLFRHLGGLGKTLYPVAFCNFVQHPRLHCAARSETFNNVDSDKARTYGLLSCLIPASRASISWIICSGN